MPREETGVQRNATARVSMGEEKVTWRRGRDGVL